MRIPHHSSRSSTGRWSFVQRVPVNLQAVLDCRLIKRTLKTKDLAQAHVRAVVLGAGCVRLFARLKDQRMDKLGKTDAGLLNACLASVGFGASHPVNPARQASVPAIGTITLGKVPDAFLAALKDSTLQAPALQRAVLLVRRRRCVQAQGRAGNTPGPAAWRPPTGSSRSACPRSVHSAGRAGAQVR